ncbi:MAG: diacylglycerol kinase family protein [Oscillospiraceae bacterium]|nr:diacylglycerol kinase family protein [Oscillospiraceae bacterium]
MIKLLRSFKYAAAGFLFCARYERNMRIHIAVTLYVLYFSRFYGFSRAEIILLILTCVSVITAEMLNTSIEVIVDRISPKYHTLAKIAKDAAAGAVLIAATAAVIIGVLLFWDVEILREILDYFAARIFAAIALVITVILTFMFIIMGKQRKRHGVRKK